MHEDPISPLKHLSRNLGITRFIRIPEIPPAQVEEKEDKTEPREKDQLNPFLRIDIGKSSLHQFLKDTSLCLKPTTM
jgi:hypothetical protein